MLNFSDKIFQNCQTIDFWDYSSAYIDTFCCSDPVTIVRHKIADIQKLTSLNSDLEMVDRYNNNSLLNIHFKSDRAHYLTIESRERGFLPSTGWKIVFHVVCVAWTLRLSPFLVDLYYICLVLVKLAVTIQLVFWRRSLVGKWFCMVIFPNSFYTFPWVLTKQQRVSVIVLMEFLKITFFRLCVIGDSL